MKSTLTAQNAPNSADADDSDNRDPYKRVTDIIIEHLENGVVPWRCPWNSETGRPRNYQTGKPYTGINVMLLGCRFERSPWWMTYRQAIDGGGQVRKGEHGALVVKFGTFEEKEDHKRGLQPDRKAKKRGFLRTFTVFNASQIDGISFPESTVSNALTPDQRIENADSIVKNMPQCPAIQEGCGGAFYNPTSDLVQMPAFAFFESPEAYYTTLYHELGHASGHASRLNRTSLMTHDSFGSKVYSMEELVAEMCAAFLAVEAGIAADNHEQSAAYLNGWLAVLKAADHRRWIVQAASQAAKAADFILRRTATDSELKSQPSA